VIASSTSGIKMSEMDGRTEHPERFVVGHPFLPPYLLPLVEVVGSPRTSPEAVAWASDFYRIAGKAVITMEKEVTGFVANRLQEAIWREAVHMVANGEATIDQIDLAVTAGPGLRWAFMGPCLSYYLAWGGDETAVPGLIETVATNAVQDYTRASVPPMTDALAAAMTSGYETLVQGRTTAELFPWRDKRILAVVKALEAADQAG
jgi:carnitine 3-dehydrogenase